MEVMKLHVKSHRATILLNLKNNENLAIHRDIGSSSTCTERCRRQRIPNTATLGALEWWTGGRNNESEFESGTVSARLVIDFLLLTRVHLFLEKDHDPLLSGRPVEPLSPFPCLS